MSPSDLATHYNADDLLAALCAKLSPEGVAAVVRAAVPFMQNEDKKVRERRMSADRSRRSYHKLHAKKAISHASVSTSNSTESASESHDETSDYDGKLDAVLTVVPPPQVSPLHPPSSPAPASTPTHARPNLEMVRSALNANTGFRIPPNDRDEFAQAYLDSRNRTEPPWTLPETFDRPARPIGADWQADLRMFSRNWQEVLDRNRLRGNGRNGSNGHAPAPSVRRLPAPEKS